MPEEREEAAREASKDDVFDAILLRPAGTHRATAAVFALCAIVSGYWEVFAPSAGHGVSLGLALAFGCATLVAVRGATADLTLTMDGVRQRSLLGSRSIAWHEIGGARLHPFEFAPRSGWEAIAFGLLAVGLSVALFMTFFLDTSGPRRVALIASVAGTMILVLRVPLRWVRRRRGVPSAFESGLEFLGPDGDVRLAFRVPLDSDAEGELKRALRSVGKKLETLA